MQGHYFVPDSVRKGVIPEILQELLAARKKAKVRLAACKDPLQRKVLQASELAYKIMANGLYGALGSKFGLLPCRIIAESTTAIGRRDNLRVQAISRELFTPENGYPEAPIVVGGDTDSVFFAFDALVRHIADKVRLHWLALQLSCSSPS